jgi:single-strand DNA-binding protein
MLNKVVLMGRLTADPEMRATKQGTPVGSFTLAVNRRTKPDEQQVADFLDIVVWGKTAEFVKRYFSKGQQVAVAGRIQSRMWEDQNGNKRKSVEIVAEEVHFAEPKRQQGGQGNAPQGGYDPGPDGWAPLPDDGSGLPF